MANDLTLDAMRSAGVRDELARALVTFAKDAPDAKLLRINPFDFAREQGFDGNEVVGAFLHAAQGGLFDLTWSVHCPKCGGKLDSVASAKSLKRGEYACTWCNVRSEATLDGVVEATFTVNPRVRRIAGHQPDQLPLDDFYRTSYFSSRLRPELVEQGRRLFKASAEIAPGEQKTLSFDAGTEGRLMLMEPVGHATYPLAVSGEATESVQKATAVFTGDSLRYEAIPFRPGPVELTVENRWSRRILPSALHLTAAVGQAFHQVRPYLTAKRLFMHPTFRELHRTDAIDINQQLKIESMTVLFTDLKGSTELYERVGDLVAFDLVRKHFEALEAAVAKQGGSVVKTIGDAVMATFPSPDAGLAAALAMREAMNELNRVTKPGELQVKIGLHDGPCLAVMLNERLDYFGQTVNIAARVQGLAEPQAILATKPVLNAEGSARLMESRRLRAAERRASLKGIRGEMALFEITG